MSFKALLTSKQGDTLSTDLVDFGEADLMAGDVTVAVDYSPINYKDGMALPGRSPVIQTFPLIGGIDLAGTVEASTYPGIEELGRPHLRTPVTHPPLVCSLLLQKQNHYFITNHPYSVRHTNSTS